MTRDAQVVVVTGAGAGAARSIARRFGEEGWRVGLISRSEARLVDAAHEIEGVGGEARTFPCDVSDCPAVFRARDAILQEWGRLDAWVNAAMVTVVGPVTEVTAAEYRRVTEVTYLGCVHGTLAALEPMLAQDRGAIVQVGSALAYRAIPLQSAYCAAKFAIRGFTDSLRAELIHVRSRITLTMLQMPGMNTPQFDWARNKLCDKYQPVGDVYDPRVAGEAALRAVRKGPRELWVGRSAIQAIAGQMLAPSTLDRYLATAAWNGQLTDEPNPHDPDNLFAPAPGHQAERGRFGDRAKPRAAIVEPRKLRAGALMAGAGLVAAGWLAGRALSRPA